MWDYVNERLDAGYYKSRNNKSVRSFVIMVIYTATIICADRIIKKRIIERINKDLEIIFSINKRKPEHLPISLKTK